MSAKSTTTKPETAKTDAVDLVVQIADIVLAQRGEAKLTLTTIARTTSRAAGLLHFEENAAAVQIARGRA
jgi:hypothetical protein